MDMLVYGNWGYPVVMFPTSMGHYHEYKDFGLTEAVRWFVETGRIKLYCISSIDLDSWYGKHLHPGTRVWNHVLYDRFLHEELVPGIQRECNVQKIGMCGVSFGGYHALNFSFRHPEQVGHLMVLSGAFDIKSFLNGYYDENVYYNNPPDYLPNAQNDEFHRMNIMLGTTEYDICKDANYQMSGLLNSKGIRHQLDVSPWGVHDWPVWKEQLPTYFGRI